MFFSTIGIFFVSFIEGKIFKFINIQQNRNFITVLFLIATTLGLVAFSLVPVLIKEGEIVWAKELGFLTEKWFYIMIALETAGLWLYREAYRIYDKDYTVVNMFMFSTVFIMPLYAFFLNNYVDLNQSVSVIDDWNSALLNSSLLFLGTVIYFYDKFKLKAIKNWRILILLGLNMLNAFYFSTKLIQTYNGSLLYAVMFVILIFNFLMLAINNKEEFKVKADNKLLAFMLTLKTVGQFIYIKSIAFVPVEIAPIVRRMGQLLAGLIIDKKMPTLTEFIGIFIIIFVFVYNFVIAG